MLSQQADPVKTLGKRDPAIAKAKLRTDGVSAVQVDVISSALGGGKEGKAMSLHIDPAKTLGEREMATIKAKLRNPDGISVVPLDVAADNLRIGVDANDFADDVDFIGRKLGYRVHTV